MAQRILAFKDGCFEPSPPPQLLQQLTNELLIMAVDAVWKAAAAASPQPSGVARYRLLAWTVADARGAATPLDKPLALTVGKRLERQAIKTRADVAAVVEAAEAAREHAREAAGRCAEGGPRKEGVPAEIAAIDAAEQARIKELREEIYIGFIELESLLPVPNDDGAPRVTTDESVGVRFPYLLENPELHVPPIPLDLANALGPDGTQALWAYAADSPGRQPDEADGWWSSTLPGFVSWLQRRDVHRQEDLARQRGFDQEDVSLAGEWTRRAEARASESAAAMEEMEESYEVEVARLQAQLREAQMRLHHAKGREEALQGVIAQWMRAQGVERGQQGGLGA